MVVVFDPQATHPPIPDYAAILAENAVLQRTINAQKAIIVSQQNEIHWYEALLANPTLPGTTKQIIGKITPPEIKMGVCDSLPEKKIYLPALAEDLKVSDKTLSRHLRKLAKETGAFTYRTDEEENAKGLPVSRTHLGFCAPLASPSSITLPPAGHGGKRIKRCPSCGSAELLERKQTQCTCCGTTIDSAWKPVNDPESSYGQDDRREDEPENPPYGQDDCRENEAVDPPDENSSCPSYVDTTVGVGTPTSNQIGFDAIPDEMKAYPQWMTWRYGPINLKTGRHQKLPFDAKEPGKSADYTNPATWCTYEQAKAMYEASQQWKMPYDGIGFVFSGDDPFFGTDFDHCRDPESGEIDEQVFARVHALATYCEISVSGTGVHCIGRGRLAANIKTEAVELYDNLRFFVFTGQHLAGTPKTIEDRQEQLDALYREIVPTHEQNSLPLATCEHIADDDQALLDRARAAKNGCGEKFRRLFDEGDTSDYGGDESRADLALVNYLAFYTGDGPDRIDHLFRLSKLMRPKWDRNAGQGLTYGQRTIQFALRKASTVDTKAREAA